MKKGIGNKLVILLMMICTVFVMGNSVKLLRNVVRYQKYMNEQKGAYNALLSEYENAIAEIENLEEMVAALTNPGNGVKAYGQLAVKNGKLVSEQGVVVSLRGLSSHGLNWYPEYTNASAMATLKKYGANVFRIAMYTDQSGGYAYEPEQNKKHMYMAIENVLSQDLYAIVDWHVMRDENPLVHIELAKQFFKEVSAHYAGHEGIIYEICNEPNGNTTWEDICKYAQEIIPIIRENSPEAIILVGTPNYSSDLSAPMEAPLEYENIMYSYHKYINILKADMYDAGLLGKAMQVGFPVFVSEWGLAYGDLESENGECYNGEELHMEQAYEFVRYMGEHDLSWCGWSLSNKSEPRSMIRSECNKLSGWTQEDMTLGGWFMAQALMYYRE